MNGCRIKLFTEHTYRDFSYDLRMLRSNIVIGKCVTFYSLLVKCINVHLLWR